MTGLLMRSSVLDWSHSHTTNFFLLLPLRYSPIVSVSNVNKESEEILVVMQ
jgi:hypothetical protein